MKINNTKGAVHDKSIFGMFLIWFLRRCGTGGGKAQN